MNIGAELSLLNRLKYNPISAALYRSYFIRRALRTGEPELHALSDIVPQGRLALDIGSNKGVYSYLLAKIGCVTHAFEPQPFFYERLRQTAPYNLQCHNVALSNIEGEQEIFTPIKNGKRLNQIATLRNISNDMDCEIVRIRTATLDSFNFSGVGFIKIDVEGWERQVLEGGASTIRRDKPVLLIEIEESHTGEELWESIDSIVSFGYSAHAFHDEAIQPLADFFDIDVHHRSHGSGRYYNNFIFLPD